MNDKINLNAKPEKQYLTTELSADWRKSEDLADHSLKVVHYDDISSKKNTEKQSISYYPGSESFVVTDKTGSRLVNKSGSFEKRDNIEHIWIVKGAGNEMDSTAISNINDKDLKTLKQLAKLDDSLKNVVEDISLRAELPELAYGWEKIKNETPSTKTKYANSKKGIEVVYNNENKSFEISDHKGTRDIYQHTITETKNSVGKGWIYNSPLDKINPDDLQTLKTLSIIDGKVVGEAFKTIKNKIDAAKPEAKNTPGTKLDATKAGRPASDVDKMLKSMNIGV